MTSDDLHTRRVDAVRAWTQFVAEGVRLLRPGGAIVVHRAALGGRAGDANASDKEVAAVREAARLIAEDERLTPVLIPLGDGLLAAARD